MYKYEKNNALAGMWLLKSFSKNLGVPFCIASSYIIRLVEKIPLFAEDVATVRTTKFIKLAAIGIPISAYIVTNGLFSGLIWS